MKAPARLETARLELVQPAEADVEEVFERYASDPDVTRYLGWHRHESIADTLAFLAFSQSQWTRWPAGPYLIRDRSTGRLLGGTGLDFDREDEASTGYVLAKDAWGQGYATEALAAIVGLSRQLRLVRLYALCHPQHNASQRVLEKGGFKRQASLIPRIDFPNLPSGTAQDVVCYELMLAPREACGRTDGE